MHPLVNIAIKATRSASKIIIRAVDRIDTLQIDTKGAHNFVTDIDRLAEQEIITIIRDAYPDHAILGEEGGQSGTSDYVWIIDPIDGTNNFFHGHPYFCTSIGVKYKDRIEHGVIYDHLRQELFTATYGAGAFLNERRIRVAQCNQVSGAVFTTNLGHGASDKDFNGYLKVFAAFLAQVTSVRHAGAAALDLAYLACGRLDGFFGVHLAPWDIAAGALLIQEAGGVVTDFAGKNSYLTTGNIIAGNPGIMKIMSHLMQGKIEQI